MMGDNISGVKTAEAIAEEKRKKELQKQQEEAERKLPYYKRKNYAQVVIGGDLTCEAVISIDYVVYNKFKIKR
jgi:putative sterol carrier protein